MPKSALPEHINEAKEWKGTDWDTWYQRWMLRFKHWFAYGPRATEWWAKWREFPITLFAAAGKGYWRFESEDWTRDSSYSYSISTAGMRNLLWEHFEDEYLSAIQYWTKWHVQIQWPFYIGFHLYFDTVPQPYEHYRGRRVFFFRAGARRDADKVYWFPCIFIGTTWN